MQSAVLVLALAFFWLPTPRAAEYRISDEVEYVATAQNLVSGGNGTVTLNHQEHPSRFIPFFSAAVLSLGVWLGGDPFQGAVNTVTLHSIVLVLLAYLIGVRLAGIWGGIGAAFSIIIDAEIRYFGSSAMTDIPSAMLFLLAFLLFDLVEDREKIARSWLLAIGMLIALASMLRESSMVLLIPFVLLLRSKRRTFTLTSGLAALFGPTVAIIIFKLTYNWIIFGTPWRSGYHYWTAVPYDYPALTFSLSYLSNNMFSLLPLLPMVLVIIAFPLLTSKMRKKGIELPVDRITFWKSVTFITVTGIPLVVFYQLYFYQSPRFYLPLTVLLLTLSGAIIGSLITLWPKAQPLVVAAALVFVAVLVAGYRYNVNSNPSVMLNALEYLAKGTKPTSVIISGINPLFVEQKTVYGTERVLIPVSRRIDYASKVVTPNAIDSLSPPPSGPFDHRAEALLKGGAQEIYSAVAVDNPEIIKKYLITGRDVFLEKTAISNEELQSLEKDFVLERITEQVYRVRLKAST
jgi:MFS family permease